MRGLLTDQNFNDSIARGLRRRLPDVQIVSVREFSLATASDEVLLEFAAEERRVFVTHDARTIEPLFYERQARELPLPVVILLPESMGVGAAIQQLWELLITTPDHEWDEARLFRLPLW